MAEAIGTRQAESERRRQRVLEAARSCFGRLGFAGATVETIAGEAGVSNGLLYQFFRNKEHLFGVAIEEAVRDWARAMPRASASRAPRPARSRRCSGAPSSSRAATPLLAALLDRGRRAPARALPAPQRRPRAGAPRSRRAHPRRGVAAGEFRADLDVPRTADLVCQLQVDYSTRAYRRDALHPVDDAMVDVAVRFIADAVRA